MVEKNSCEKRVVITGMGMVTSIGTGIDEFWKNATSGKSGVSMIESFDVSKTASKIAAQIKDFDPKEFISFKAARRMDRFAQFAVAATSLALKDAGLKVNYHLMPGMPGSDPAMDIDTARMIFSDERFMPDMIKIYPTLVIEGTELHDMWKRGE